MKAVSLGSLLIFTFSFLLDVRTHSRAVILLDWLLLIVFLFGLRMAFRLFIQNKAGQTTGGKKNVLIVGATDAGELLLREIDRNSRLKLNPVGFIDNDPQMLGRVIHGVKVLGRGSDLAEIILVKDVDEVFVTTSDESKLRKIIDFCRQANVRCRLIPALKDIVSDRIKINYEGGPIS